MKRHALLVGALASTFVAGCAEPGAKNTPELYDASTQTGTHIDKPGLPPGMTDQSQLQRAFRGNGSAIVPDPGQR